MSDLLWATGTEVSSHRSRLLAMDISRRRGRERSRTHSTSAGLNLERDSWSASL